MGDVIMAREAFTANAMISLKSGWTATGLRVCLARRHQR